MPDQRRPDVRSMSVDQVYNAFRNACFLARLNKIQRRKGHVLPRFQYDGVAADKRRDQLPRRYRHREIERRDEPADAYRLTNTHREFVRHLSWRGKAVKPSTLARGIIRAIDRFLDVAAGFLQNLAHFARHLARKRV